MSVPATVVDAPEPSGFEPQIVTSTGVEFSPTLSEIAKALIRAQSSMDEVFKDSTNPHFRSKYAGLPACINATKPALLANGIALLQPATSSPDASVVFVTTMFLHESGEWMRCKLGLQPAKEDPQGAGSAITYGRRYTLLGMCGVAPEDDDDGNAASRAPRAAQQQRRTNPAPAPANAPQPAERPGNGKLTPLISRDTVDKIFAAFARIGADRALESALLTTATNHRIDAPERVADLTVPEAKNLSTLIAEIEAKRAAEPVQCPDCKGLDGQHLDDDLGPCVSDDSPRAIRIRAGEASAEYYPELQEELPL